MRTAPLLPLALTFVVGACGGRPLPPPPDLTETEPLPSATAQDPTRAARAAFENPGGMWPPPLLAAHAEQLRKLGLELDPSALSDPMAYPLGAVVWLGGCSASFVSPQGLVITNHHCATGALQFNSTPERNMLEQGFLAKSRADERSNGPTARVYVTQSFRDVTSEVRRGIEQMGDPLARHRAIEQRIKDLVAGCEKGRAELRCNVASYFGGEQYLLIEKLELRDVRLVYAPAEGVGNYGGEIDNWRWPRHSGDFAFFRVYVGPDGKPADFSAKNVPYRPKHHLRIASKPLAAGDLVMVAGYPGRTTRLRTAAEVAEAVDWYYPRRARLCEDYIALLEKISAGDDKLAIKSRWLLRGLSNVLTNTRGMLDGLVKGGLKDEKTRLEAELKAWTASKPEHASAAKAIDNLSTHYARYRAKRDQDAATSEAVWMSTLLGAADKIVHMAEERPKPDAKRHPDFQKRNHQRLAQGQQRAQRNYARALDKAKLGLALRRAARLPADKRPALLELIVGKGEPTPAAIDKALDAMYGKTELESAERRVALLESATTEELRKSADPFIELALGLRPLLRAAEERRHAYEGATAIDRPRFAAALRAKNDGVLAPDANSTLRVTYGTVRGYRPKPEAPSYLPFTKLSEMVAKNTGKRPFDAPAKLVAGAKQGPFGPYVHEPLGEVPVDFLADLDITGGNSGSATLNTRGELVGLAFDGNYEAMASDWLFMPSITRSIHVDLRYALWMMDRVDGADHLLTEMGITPALP